MIYLVQKFKVQSLKFKNCHKKIIRKINSVVWKTYSNLAETANASLEHLNLLEL